MGYAPPIYTSESEQTAVFRHNRADDLCPEFGYAVTENAPRENLCDLLTILKDDSPEGRETLKDIFRTMANVEQDGEGTFTIMHAVRAGDPINNMNAKMPTLHAHVFGADFTDEYSHIVDKKTYAARKNPKLKEAILSATADDNTAFQKFKLNADDAEAKSHDVLTHKGFANFKDFANNATDADWDAFAENMIEMIEPTVQEGAGGSRIVIDDRYFSTGNFTVQVLSGEKMHSSANKDEKWFNDGPEPETP